MDAKEKEIHLAWQIWTLIWRLNDLIWDRYEQPFMKILSNKRCVLVQDDTDDIANCHESD